MYSDLEFSLVLMEWGLHCHRWGASVAGHTPFDPIAGASPWGELACECVGLGCCTASVSSEAMVLNSDLVVNYYLIN